MARWQKRDPETGNITFQTGEGTYTFGPGVTDEKLGRLATEILSYLGCSFEIKWPEHAARVTDEDRLAARRRLIEDAAHYAAGQTGEDEDDPVHRLVKQAYLAGWTASPKPVTTIIR